MWAKNCRNLRHWTLVSRTTHNGGTVKCCSTVPAEETKKEPPPSGFKNFRFKYPEFLPYLDVKKRNMLREKLERRDMLRRRNVINIPEFYVGSILAVTVSDPHAVGKVARFVGICISIKSLGLSSTFILRNVIDHEGVEIQYDLYSPALRKIEVLKLEKRLDDNLLYLRDAPHEYSTFPFDMEVEWVGDKTKVLTNTIKVPLNPRPWIQRYERMNLQGVILPPLSEKIMKQAVDRAKPWEKYDLMDEYRRSIPEEEQKDIFTEICEELHKLELKQTVEKRKKEYVKPKRQKLF